MILGALAAREDVCAAEGLVPAAAGSAAKERHAFAVASRDGLRAGRLDLPPMLSAANLSLATRVELLAVFLRGFLSGLGQAGERLAGVGTEGEGMLGDLETLSRGAALEGGKAAGAEERAYGELLEYLRFAAVYFYRTLA